MADAPPQPAFKVPPEVPRYFSERGLKPSFSWLDTWGEARQAKRFTPTGCGILHLRRS